jgi:hypothetical protein
MEKLMSKEDTETWSVIEQDVTAVNYMVPRSNAIKQILKTAGVVNPAKHMIGRVAVYILTAEDVLTLETKGYLIENKGTTDTEGVYWADLYKASRRVRTPLAAGEVSHVAKEAFLALCKKHDGRNTKEEDLQAVRRLIEEHRTAMIGLIRTLAKLELRRSHSGTLEYMADFDAILKLNKITDVKVIDNTLHVYTTILNCVDDRTGKMHELGNYFITICLSTGNIRFKNLSRTVQSFDSQAMQAPHVFADGHPCWGNIEETVTDLVGKLQLSALITLLLEFLQSANTKDPAGKGINLWPLVSIKEAT